MSFFHKVKEHYNQFIKNYKQLSKNQCPGFDTTKELLGDNDYEAILNTVYRIMPGIRKENIYLKYCEKKHSHCDFRMVKIFLNEDYAEDRLYLTNTTLEACTNPRCTYVSMNMYTRCGKDCILKK